MVAYTRQSTISDGDTITAALFNDEYNQLLSAFSYASSGTTGHKHDGTAGEGGNIPQIGDQDFLNKIVTDSTNNRFGIFVQVSSSAVEQIRIQDGAIVPVTDNDIDLGTSSVEFKDAFFDGTVTTDALVADTADINGGTVDGATIGANSASTGAFTTLTASGNFTGSGTIEGTTITATTAFVPDASDGAALGTSSLEFSDLFLADGAVINFGDDQDVTLTHVADTGLLLNGTSQLQFNDASQNITAPSATVLDINATDEIELNATLVDVNANLDVSGTYTGAGLMTTGGNIVIPNDGNIGSVGDTDAMAISSSGVVTFSQNPVFPDGGVPLADLDIDGASDIGAGLADADLFIVDDGAGGTNRKTAASRIKTYIADVTLTTAAQSNITSLGTLTALTVDDIGINGKAITMTGSTDDTATLTVGTNGTLTIETVDTAATAANIQVTADGTFEVDATTITLDSSGDIVLDADDADVVFKDAGTTIATLTNSSSDFVITTGVQDKDFIVKGDDNGATITALTLDMSEAGAATFNGAVTSGAVITSGAGLLIADGGNIGSASDPDAIAIASDGAVTFSQTPVFPDGSIPLADLDIDGAADIGAAIADADLFIIDDGAGGTNRKVAASRIKTYIGSIAADDLSAGDAAINLETTSGNITIDAQGNDTDIILKGTDGGADKTGIKIDMSENAQIQLPNDSQVLAFGADQDTTLTHTDGTGLTLNSTNKLTFGDAASFVQQSSDGVLRIDGEATIDLNASTAVTVSNDLKLDSDAAVLGFGADNDVTLTHVADTGLLLNGTSQLQFNDASQNITAPSATVLDINATDEVELNATLVDVNANLDVSGTYTGGGLMTTGGNIVIPDDGNIGSASDTSAIAIAANGVVTFTDAPVFPDGSLAIADLDIDGGTDISADLTDADLIIVDDGAGGTNRKAALSRIKTYIGTTGSVRNYINNPEFNVHQRGSTIDAATVGEQNNDGSYTLDQWVLLSDGDDIVDVKSQTSDVPTGSSTAMELEVETANKKFGVVQFIENVNCQSIIGQEVTVSFQAKATSDLDDVRCAIIAWSGTKDAPTNDSPASEDDMISAWNAEGTNPTLNTNFTYENTPADLNVTTSFAKYSVTATIDTSSTTNVAVFIFSNVTGTTAGDTADKLHIGQVQLEKGDEASNFNFENYTDHVQRCQRYFQGYCGNTGSSTVLYHTGHAFTASARSRVMLITPMRTGPTVTFLNYNVIGKTGGAITGITYTQVTTPLINAIGFNTSHNTLSGFNTPTGIDGAKQVIYFVNTGGFFFMSAELGA